MRLAFLGKGGSGKTTVATAFIQYLRATVPFVVAIDADVNRHLGRGLGLLDAKGFAAHHDAIADYLINDPAVPVAARIGTTPPTRTARFLRPQAADPFLRRYAAQAPGLALLTVGSYETADVGYACYHEKLGTLELVLHHTLDGAGDYLVADVVTGTDNLGTSLAFAYDLNVFVVEPTRKSLAVYADFVALAAPLRQRVRVVINKAEDEADIAFVRNHVPPDDILGVIGYAPAMRQYEEGDPAAIGAFVAANQGTLAAIRAEADGLTRDWATYLARLQAAHATMVGQWYTHVAGSARATDAAFSYAAALAQP
ncbi:MAG: ATP-binding protein [Ktedonobacterales bacterium]|nr:ATP-binding protein [Ktedonobacterales bacterium]